MSNARRRRLHEMAHNANKDADTELIEVAQDLEKQVETLQHEKRTLQEENRNLQEELELFRLEAEIDREDIQEVLDRRRET